MSDDLTKDQAERILSGHCPDCEYRGFVLGPRGGAAQNIECGNVECRARFNIVPLPTVPMSLWGQRIEKQRDGGFTWGSEPK